ncbi:MAG: poly-gamma-glutamate hydrolase family protein [Anaerolineaceae bacterium]|nr:poly-gamma-glutamate hydrolase family protein [Anaerolineaceae bacterium]
MTSAQKITSFTDLQNSGAQEGVDYRIINQERPSKVTVLAPHGGGIEPGTTELARGLAADDFSLYIFEGIQPGGNKNLHISSTNFDEPRCLEILSHTQTVLSVHGYKGKQEMVYIGGLDQTGRRAFFRALAAAGFPVEKARGSLAGRSLDNICNQGQSGRGVQFELTDGFRRTLFRDLTPSGRKQPLPLFHLFVSVCREVLLGFESIYQPNSG